MHGIVSIFFIVVWLVIDLLIIDENVFMIVPTLYLRKKNLNPLIFFEIQYQVPMFYLSGVFFYLPDPLYSLQNKN